MIGSLSSRGKVLVLLPTLLAISACGVFGGNNSKRPRTPVLGERVAILTSEAAAEAAAGAEAAADAAAEAAEAAGAAAAGASFGAAAATGAASDLADGCWRAAVRTGCSAGAAF